VNYGVARVEEEAGSYLLAEANMKMDVAVKDGKLTFSVPGQPTYTLEPVAGQALQARGDGRLLRHLPPVEGRPEGDGNLPRTAAGQLHLEENQARGREDRRASGASTPSTRARSRRSSARTTAKGGGPALEVAVRDGQVVLVLPGQPAYPLVERSKDVLGSTALPEAYSFLVRRDAAGNVVGITVKQPEGEFAFNRAAEFKSALTVDEIMRRPSRPRAARRRCASTRRGAWRSS
jgi:hypothetical protein